MSTKVKLTTVLASVVIGLTGCGQEASDGGGGGEQPEGGGTELAVTAQDFSFEVEGVTLPEAGGEVTVTLVNQGEAPHTFSSEEVGLDIAADPGGEGSGSFTVPDDGTADFQCDIHPDQMKLTLTAGETASSDAGAGGSKSETETGSEDTGTGDDDYDY
jgi:plastocyanin